MTNYPMTPEGRDALEQKLQHLSTEVRYKIVADIEEARAHGDISENSEFEDAKERQALNEGMIQDIQAKLSLAEVIDVTKLPGHDLPDDDAGKKVVFGSTVLLVDEEDEEYTYRIVGTDESDLSRGWISFQTPVARALLGNCPGDSVTIVLPSKTREYEILEVYYR